MTPHDRLHQVWSTMQECLREFGQVYLAGGAVRDTLLGRTPKDYDVFVLNPTPFEEIREQIDQRVAQFPAVAAVVEFHKSEPFLVKTMHVLDAEVQVMVTPYPDVQQLVGSFDWDVCLFAYGEEGYISRGDLKLVKPGGELKLNRITFPYSTLRRGYRFSERFGMKLPNATVDRILLHIWCSKPGSRDFS